MLNVESGSTLSKHCACKELRTPVNVTGYSPLMKHCTIKWKRLWKGMLCNL